MAEAINIHMAKNVSVLKWDALSATEQIRWVKELMQCELDNLTELKTGAVYCQIIHSLYPNAVRMDQVKLMTRFEPDFEHNFAILENAFRELNVRQTIGFRQLIKGRSHLEFLNWLRKFYKVNNRDRYYDPVKERGGKPIGLRKQSTQPSADYKQYFQRSATLDSIPSSFHIRGTITRSRSSNNFESDGESWAIKLTACEPVYDDVPSSDTAQKPKQQHSQSTQAEFDWDAAVKEQQKLKNIKKKTQNMQHINPEMKHKSTGTIPKIIKHQDQFKTNKSTQAEFDAKKPTIPDVNMKTEHKPINNIFSNTETSSAQGDIKWDTYFKDWKNWQKTHDTNNSQKEATTEATEVPDVDDDSDQEVQSRIEWSSHFKDWKMQTEASKQDKQDEHNLNQNVQADPPEVPDTNPNAVPVQPDSESVANRKQRAKKYNDRVKEHAALRKQNAEILTTLSEIYEIAFNEGDDPNTARRKLMDFFKSKDMDQL
ncbi:hypothetical protein ACLKA7_005983 [Drosophila subpalustris]